MSVRRAPAIALVAVAIALLAAVSVIAADAASGPAAGILASAGPIASHGAPVASLLADLSGSLVLGGAVVAGWVVRRDEDRRRALGGVTAGSVVWTLAQLALLLASYAVATGQPVGAPSFGSDLPVYLGTELGAWLLASLVLAAATTVVAVGTTGRRGARIAAVVAGASLLSKAMTGHAAGTAGHETATSTMLVHLLGAGVWIGGLAALQLLPARAGKGREDVAVIRRYSRLALVCWVAMLASGVWALAVRLNGLGDLLTSAYAQLAAIKALLLILLGAAGVLQRRLLAEDAEHDARFDGVLHRRLALLELALMGLAVALAAAMSSSPPPAERARAASDPAELLTGFPLPARPTVAHVLTAWRPDVFSLAAVSVLALLWWWPTAPRRSRPRTALLVAALVAALAVQCGPLAVYGEVLVSAHLLQHLALVTVVGPLLGAAFGLRMPARGRRPALGAVLVAVVTAAIVPLWYASPLLRPALSSHVPHLALVIVSVLCGMTLAAAARRSAAAVPAAGLVLAGSGLVLALGTTLIVPSWFGATGRPWLRDALADQRGGGWVVLAWAAVATVVGTLLARRAHATAHDRGAASSNSARTVARRASRSPRSAKGS